MPEAPGSGANAAKPGPRARCGSVIRARSDAVGVRAADAAALPSSARPAAAASATVLVAIARRIRGTIPRASAPVNAAGPLLGFGGLREALEGHARVGERAPVDGGAGADERLHRLVHVPDVHVHAGDDAVVVEPEGHELPRG